MKKIYLVLAFLSVFQLSSAQDAEFSQFYASPMYTNPALAGAGLCGGRVVLNYRNQWPSLSGTFRTFAGSYDQQSERLGGGFGFSAFQDVAGDGLLTTTAINGVYAYRVQINRRWFINLAVQGGYVQRSIDFSRLRFADQIEAKLGFVKPTQENLPNEHIGFANLGAGALVYKKGFYAGFAVHNLTQPSQSFYGNTGGGTYLPRRFTLHSGLEFAIVKSRDPMKQVTFSPNILVMVQQKFNQVNFGFYLNKGPLIMGLWMRNTSANPDAIIALAGFRQGDFKFGYSYDFTVSKARTAAPGSHEISVAYLFCFRDKPRPPQTNRICPGL